MGHATGLLMDLWHMSELSCLTFGRDRSPLWNSKYATAARLAILSDRRTSSAIMLIPCNCKYVLSFFSAIFRPLIVHCHFLTSLVTTFHVFYVLIMCAFLICQPCVRWAQCVVIGHWWFLLPTTSSCCAFSALTRLGVRKGIRPVKKWGMVEVGTG